jgi:hypothetical protein
VNIHRKIKNGKLKIKNEWEMEKMLDEKDTGYWILDKKDAGREKKRKVLHAGSERYGDCWAGMQAQTEIPVPQVHNLEKR